MDPIDKAIMELDLAAQEIQDARELRDMVGRYLEAIVLAAKEKGPLVAGLLVRAALDAVIKTGK